MRKLIVLFFVICCSKQLKAQQTVIQQVDSLISDYQQLDIFSGVVLIAENDLPFYHRAFGLANRTINTPNTTDTRFLIGSMNKTFTHILVLQLIQEGKLQFTDKMANYLEGFTQPNATKITIEQLINHQSGFGDYYGERYRELPYEKKNIQGILPLLYNAPLEFEPGNGNEYSNAGYIILGAIIEKITGKSYSQNVQERIVIPLGLSTLITNNIKATPNRAIGYIKTIDGYEDNEIFLAEPRSDGGFYATAKDILRFYRAYFYDDVLLSREIKMKDNFFKRIQSLYQQKGRGIPIAGGMNGANTVYIAMLGDHKSIVVMANMDEPVGEKLAVGLTQIINGKTPAKPSLPAILNVYKAYTSKGIVYVQDNFDSLTTNWFDGEPKFIILNSIGFKLMEKNKLDPTLDFFSLSVARFPASPRSWLGYAQALSKKGRKTDAIAAYKKALSLNPNMEMAKKELSLLEQ